MIGNRNYKVPKGRVLVMRTCTEYGFSYANFSWPESGPVSCTDWKPEAVCGHGLHGALWGEGAGSLFRWTSSAIWQVVEVPTDSIIDLDGKVKFPAGVVVAVGNRQRVTSWLGSKAPGHAIIGATDSVGMDSMALVGDRGHAISGDHSASTAGDHGSAISGIYGRSTVGRYGDATAGSFGTARAGDYGSAIAGEQGTAIAGARGTAKVGTGGLAKAGPSGVAEAGYMGSASAGLNGQVRITWKDRFNSDVFDRLAVGYVGFNVVGSLLPDQVYSCNSNGLLVPAL